MKEPTSVLQVNSARRANRFAEKDASVSADHQLDLFTREGTVTEIYHSRATVVYRSV